MREQAIANSLRMARFSMVLKWWNLYRRRIIFLECAFFPAVSIRKR